MMLLNMASEHELQSKIVSLQHGLIFDVCLDWTSQKYNQIPVYLEVLMKTWNENADGDLYRRPRFLWCYTGIVSVSHTLMHVSKPFNGKQRCCDFLELGTFERWDESNGQVFSKSLQQWPT